jgi:LytS/YehU family sensor histidine kinase
MPGLFSTRRGAALYLLAWLLLGGILSILIVVTAHAAWINTLVLALPITLVYAFGTGFSAYYLCRAYPLAEKSPFQILPVFGMAAVISSLLWLALAHLWNDLTLAARLDWAGMTIGPTVAALIFGLGVLFYGLSAVADYLVFEFERARNAERRELESQLMAQTAELRMLRTQIDPHFLFNSLHSISALTSQNPAGARDMTLQLADFFRQSLGLAAHQKITLDAEIALCLRFLAIEQVRFGTRLQVAVAAPPDARACLVPPMLIQPLVENAVKHGIGNLTEGGLIRITAECRGALLHIVVENAIDTDTGLPRANGIGLRNVQQRLHAAYGHTAHMHFGRQSDQFRVEIALPAETSS